jgi:hypothetical protein
MSQMGDVIQARDVVYHYRAGRYTVPKAMGDFIVNTVLKCTVESIHPME